MQSGIAFPFRFSVSCPSPPLWKLLPRPLRLQLLTQDRPINVVVRGAIHAAHLSSRSCYVAASSPPNLNFLVQLVDKLSSTPLENASQNRTPQSYINACCNAQLPRLSFYYNFCYRKSNWGKVE